MLVTGGAGFIGSHIVDALLADGHDCEVVDPRLAVRGGAPGARPTTSIPGRTCIVGDVTDASRGGVVRAWG